MLVVLEVIGVMVDAVVVFAAVLVLVHLLFSAFLLLSCVACLSIWVFVASHFWPHEVLP